jgi:Fic family protein
VLSPEAILKLHSLTRPEIWDSGQFKKEDGEIIEKHPDGRVTVRFRPTSARETPEAMSQLCLLSERSLREKQVPPLVVWAAQNLDFLCVHPFRDGNGRVSRLLLLLSLYQLGFTAGRYISLERLIEQNKERYYETLEESSQNWHEGKHNPWPYINYLLSILKASYKEFEERLGQVKSPKGAKTALIESAVRNFTGEFTLNDLERACPGVSRDMVRRVLRDLQKSERVECLGRGPGALWRGKRGNTLKKG